VLHRHKSINLDNLNIQAQEHSAVCVFNVNQATKDKEQSLIPFG